MQPTINAIKAGVNVALANKESLVMAGNIINKELENSDAKLFPVDSEHSAIWQCMVEKIWMISIVSFSQEVRSI